MACLEKAKTRTEWLEKGQQRCIACIKPIIYAGTLQALVCIVLKITLGLSSGSRALVAASLYSIQDLISSLVAAIGLNISSRPPDRNHPYGYGKAESIVVGFVSLMLLLGVAAVVITSFETLWGEALAAEAPQMMACWIAGICATSSWLLSHWQKCAGNRLNSPALKSCATHMKNDTLSGIGVIISVLGAKLGFPALDHIVAIIEGVHVIYDSGRILLSAISDLMDAPSEPAVIEKLREAVGSAAAGLPVGTIAARWSGQMLLVDVTVKMPATAKVAQVEELHGRIRQAVSAQVCNRNQTFVRIVPAA